MASRFGVGRGAGGGGNGNGNNRGPSWAQAAGGGRGGGGAPAPAMNPARARLMYQGRNVTFRSGTASGSVARPVLVDPSQGDVNRFHIGEDTIIDGACPPHKHQNGSQAMAITTRGGGTLDDPEIIWLYNSNRGLDKLEQEAARQAAKAAGMRCIVIRRNLHNTFARKTAGSALPSNLTIMQPGRIALHDRGDWHMTVFLGHTFRRLVLQGHVFCFPMSNIPKQHQVIYDPADRQFPRSDDDKDKTYYEYWLMPRVKARDSQGAERNWQPSNPANRTT